MPTVGANNDYEPNTINGHTCIKDDGGTPGRRCLACADEAGPRGAYDARPDRLSRITGRDPIRRTGEIGTIGVVLAEVWAERVRQNSLWGHKHEDEQHTANEWVAYITRYLGEAAYSFLWKDPGQFIKPEFRKSMVKIAALAVAAVEWVDRKSA